MALINCPECNREISDKAKACPHCGYPISENVNVYTENKVKIDGKIYDISKLKKMYDKYSDSDKKEICRNCNNAYKKWYNSGIESEISSHDKGGNLIQWIGTTLKWWPNNKKQYFAYKFLAECRAHNFKYFEFNTTDYVKSTSQQEFIPQRNVVRCPRCGSTSVTTEEQGYGLFGWIGASQKKNLCQKCGHKWWPGR